MSAWCVPTPLLPGSLDHGVRSLSVKDTKPGSGVKTKFSETEILFSFRFPSKCSKHIVKLNFPLSSNMRASAKRQTHSDRETSRQGCGQKKDDLHSASQPVKDRKTWTWPGHRPPSACPHGFLSADLIPATPLVKVLTSYSGLTMGDGF